MVANRSEEASLGNLLIFVTARTTQKKSLPITTNVILAIGSQLAGKPFFPTTTEAAGLAAVALALHHLPLLKEPL